jgi:hypothetical protein
VSGVQGLRNMVPPSMGQPRPGVRATFFESEGDANTIDDEIAFHVFLFRPATS